MKKRAKICSAQKQTDWVESVQSRAKQFPGWFGKHPASVLIDFSITSDAKVLMGILALKTYKTHTKCNTVDFTLREMAELFSKSAATVSGWVKQLEVAGHIRKLSGKKSRSVYRLVSPAFDYRVRVETAPNEAVDIGSKDLQHVRDQKTRCPKCKQMARIKSTSGVCAACLAEWARKTA